MAYELFFDGFESYGDSGNGDLLNKFGYSNLGTWQAQGRVTTGRRTGTKGFYMYPDSGYFTLRKPITASSHVVCSFAFLVAASPDAITIRFMEGASIEHARLVVKASNKLVLTVGAESAVESASSLGTNTWRHIALGLHCSNSGSYEARLDDSSVGWFPATNADTQNGGTGLIDNIQISTSGSNGSSIDDFHIAFGDELVWKGDRRIDLLDLDGDDTPQDWTPSSGNAWERLNAGDGYVASNIDEATSLFTLANLPYAPNIIEGVAVRSLMNKSDAGSRGAAVLLKSGSTEIESAELALSTDTLGLTEVFRVDPATSAAWTANAVNALRAGVRVKT